MKVFFDTSSFVKRFVEEVGSKRADDITQEASEIGLSIREMETNNHPT